jgi:hypothetical protein
LIVRPKGIQLPCANSALALSVAMGLISCWICSTVQPSSETALVVSQA